MYVMYVCKECMYVCMFVCYIYTYIYICIHVCMSVRPSVRLFWLVLNWGRKARWRSQDALHLGRWVLAYNLFERAYSVTRKRRKSTMRRRSGRIKSGRSRKIKNAKPKCTLPIKPLVAQPSWCLSFCVSLSDWVVVPWLRPDSLFLAVKFLEIIWS